MLFSALILRVGDAFPFSLQSLTYRPNLYVVNGSEEWGQDEQERVKDTISRKEVMPLMKGMETATYNGHNESKEECVKENFLSLRDGQARFILRQAFTNFDESFHSPSQYRVDNEIFHVIQVQEERGRA